MNVYVSSEHLEPCHNEYYQVASQISTSKYNALYISCTSWLTHRPKQAKQSPISNTVERKPLYVIPG